MRYYEHNIGDYEAATSHLTEWEDLAYTRLMRVYYRDEKPIPADVADACRLVRAKTKPFQRAVESVLKEFFNLTSDGWRNNGCDKRIQKYHKKSEKAAASANARWSQCERIPDAMLTKNQEPITNNQKTKSTSNHVPPPPLPPKGGDGDPPKRRSLKLPENLRTDEFKRAWADWVQHRKEIKKELKPTQAEKLIAKLARWGPERSIAAIIYTIEKGWQGLKEPDHDDETRRTNGTRGSGSAGGDRFDREQARENKQLGTLTDWAASREAAESVQAGGICPSDGAPDGDEAHRRIDAAPA